ncbi:hypothetical protein J2S68_004863 [Glycomyces algeriensis]|nr:hypothetical protein [Glycomyces algeriensis]
MPVPAPSPAPQAAATAPAHNSARQVHGAQPWVPSGRVRNRRDRQRAARCLTGPDQARVSRASRLRRGAVESP